MEGALESLIPPIEEARRETSPPPRSKDEAVLVLPPGTTDCERAGDAWRNELCLTGGAGRPLYPPPKVELGRPGEATRGLLPPVGQYCDVSSACSS